MLQKYIKKSIYYLDIIKKFLILLKSYVLTILNSLDPINRENILYIPDVDKCMNQHILCDI